MISELTAVIKSLSSLVESLGYEKETLTSDRDYYKRELEERERANASLSEKYEKQSAELNELKQALRLFGPLPIIGPLPITGFAFDELVNMIKMHYPNKRIEAIKFLRALSGCDLLTAKTWIESYTHPVSKSNDVSP